MASATNQLLDSSLLSVAIIHKSPGKHTLFFGDMASIGNVGVP